MKKNHALDLTQGKPLPLLIRFAIPLVLGTIFQQLYSFADTAIVGRCIGPDALTAVGITGSLNFVILGFSMGCAVDFGVSALASGVMEVIGRSTSGLLAVHYGSFFIICLSAPMSWSMGLLCCVCLCAYYIPRETRKLAAK